MGSDLWMHQTPWHEDPASALRDLQARLFTEQYEPFDPARELQEDLIDAKNAQRDAQAEGDPYGLADHYGHVAETYEELSKEPMPTDVASKIKLLQKIWEAQGEEIGGILDVTDVQPAPPSGSQPVEQEPMEQETAQPWMRLGTDAFFHGFDGRIAFSLGESDMLRLVGAARPSLKQAEESAHKIQVELGRGDCVCFPIYDESPDRKPLGWYFVGCTLD
jgi:hypothetical protein